MSFDPAGMYVPRHELDAERARAEVAEARCRELAMGACVEALRAERYRRRAFAMLRIARSLRQRMDGYIALACANVIRVLD